MLITIGNSTAQKKGTYPFDSIAVGESFFVEGIDKYASLRTLSSRRNNRTEKRFTVAIPHNPARVEVARTA